MKVVDEIGLKKTSKFIIYSFLEVIYNLCFLPPLRKIFLVFLGAKIGKGSVIMGARFFNWHHGGPSGLNIGDECFIGDETMIDLYEKVILKDKVTVAQRVTILTHLNVGYQNHPLQKFFAKTSKPVILKNGCVVAAASIILPGVTIGQQSFVAAGSVVTKDISPNTLVAGVPAKIIRKIK